MSFGRNYISSQNRNDCAIASLSVYYGIPYNEAFDIFHKHYSKRGTNTQAIINHLREYGSKVTFAGNTASAKWFGAGMVREKGMTLDTFCKKYPKGTYYVLVRGHALVVKDGETFDITNTSKNRRIFAFATYNTIG